MLLQFFVENFLSFKERAVVTFQASGIKEHKENVFHNSLNKSLPLLKSIGLFGKNASGKSNFIKAIAFMKEFVLNSSKESSSLESIKINPFLLSSLTDARPSTLEVIFVLNNLKYRYGFSVTEKVVQSEWLFVTRKIKEESIFLRAGKDFSFDKSFQINAKNRLHLYTEITRPNSLFISVLSQFNDSIGTSIYGWFNDLIIAQDSAHLNLIEFTARLMGNSDYRKLINDIIKRSDVGIESVEERLREASIKKSYSYDFLVSVFNDEDRVYTVKTKHIKYNEKKDTLETLTFDLLQNESYGTQKLFGILGPILYALKTKKVLWIDEIDSKLHSLLFEQVINIFNSKKYNPNGAQLIFTSHNTTILKKGLRRDQIILVEKNSYGESTINSLYEKHPKVRNDASFDKDYLIGKYGAIPQLSSQLNLFDGL